jgi:hypothetical protein
MELSSLIERFHMPGDFVARKLPRLKLTVSNGSYEMQAEISLIFCLLLV